MRYAIVDNGKVVNVIEAPEGWSDPGRRSLVQSDTASKGDDYDGVTFTTPAPAPKEPTPEQLEYAEASTDPDRIALIAKHLGLI